MSTAQDTLTVLMAGLESPDKPVVRAAADRLIALARTEPEVPAMLEEALADRRRANPWALAYVLGHLPQPSSTTIAALIDGLDQPASDVRWALGLLLVRLMASEAAIANMLLEVASRGTVPQRRMALYCIRDAGLRDRASLDTLLRATTDADSSVRVAAVTSLHARPDNDAEGRRRLLNLFLDDPDVKVASCSAITLAKLGERSAEFISALEAAEQSAQPQLKKAADLALGLLKSERPASIGATSDR